MTKNQRILELAGYAGCILLKNGAEIFRVQDTMSKIIECFGITNYHVYVLSNGIFATIGEGTIDHCSFVRYVPLDNTNLSRVDGVNSVSRGLQSGLYDIDSAMEKLKEVEIFIPQPKWIQAVASGVGSMSFCYVFGGNLGDCFCVFLIGVFLRLYVLSPFKTKSSFTTTILRAAFATIGAALCTISSPVLNFDYIVIGIIFALFPGVMFTNSIREFFNGDYLSGIIHMIHAILTAVCIALGVCSVIVFFREVGGISL